jgi:hypothetical protein
MHLETGAFLKLGNEILYKYLLAYIAFVSIIQYKNNRLLSQ